MISNTSIVYFRFVRQYFKKSESSMKYPKERRSRSSVLLNSPSGPKLLVIGGTDYIGFTCEDCWTLDIKKIIWNEVIIISTI